MKIFTIAFLMIISSFCVANENEQVDFSKFSYRNIQFVEDIDSISRRNDFKCVDNKCSHVTDDSEFDIYFLNGKIHLMQDVKRIQGNTKCSEIIQSYQSFFTKTYKAEVKLIPKAVSYYPVLINRHDDNRLIGYVPTNNGKITVDIECLKDYRTNQTTIINKFEFADILIQDFNNDFKYNNN